MSRSTFGPPGHTACPWSPGNGSGSKHNVVYIQNHLRGPRLRPVRGHFGFLGSAREIQTDCELIWGILVRSELVEGANQATRAGSNNNVAHSQNQPLSPSLRPVRGPGPGLGGKLRSKPLFRPRGGSMQVLNLRSNGTAQNCHRNCHRTLTLAPAVL